MCVEGYGVDAQILTRKSEIRKGKRKKKIKERANGLEEKLYRSNFLSPLPYITIARTHFHTGTWRVNSAGSLTQVDGGVWLSALPDFKKIISPKTNLSFLVNSSIFKYNLCLMFLSLFFFFNDYQRSGKHLGDCAFLKVPSATLSSFLAMV